MKNGRQHSCVRRLHKPVLSFLLLCALLSKSYAQIGPPPVITVEPLDQIVLLGGTAVFTVVAVSLTPMTYQWRCNGTNIPGAIGATYTRLNVQLGDAGNYRVRISNASGSTYSSNALLTVTTRTTTPLQFVSASMASDGFRCQLSGPAGSNYVILVSTNLRDWTPIATNAAPNGTLEFLDPGATARDRRFYRALLQ